MKKSQRKPLSLEKREARTGYVFILPLILGVSLLFLPMMAKTVAYSMSDINIVPEGYSLSYRGFDYYIKALTEDPHFNRYAVESLGMLVTRVPIIILFSLVVATMLNDSFKGRIIMRSMFFIPVILASGIAAGNSLMGNLEAHNTVVESSIQLNQVTQLLLSMNFSRTLIDVISEAADQISSIVNASGLQIFILLTAFQEVPPSLYEAAQVEGCSAWEQFWKISIPLVSPQIVVTAVYSLVDSYVRSDGKAFGYIYNKVFSTGDYSFGTAMYLLYLSGLVLLLGLVWLISRKHIIYND